MKKTVIINKNGLYYSKRDYVTETNKLNNDTIFKSVVAAKRECKQLNNTCKELKSLNLTQGIYSKAPYKIKKIEELFKNDL